MNIRRAGGRPFNGLPPAAVLTAAGAPAITAGARVGGGKRVGERSAAIAARSVMWGRSIPRAAALGYMGEGRAWGKPRVRAKRAQCKNSFSALDNQRKVLYNKSNTTYERNLRMNTTNNTPTAKSGVSGVVIPVFAAVALIISCAIYIVYKLGQQEAAEKWADYDECGWS